VHAVITQGCTYVVAAVAFMDNIGFDEDDEGVVTDAL
jgi:hypothetical protein